MPILKKIDIYIIKKFLSTYVFSIILIIGIAVIFDFSEKIDDFIENNAPFNKILSDYYLNFMPYFAVLFSSLFVFISVIFFTSKMAYNTEIIAILSNGVSYRRMLVPYFISAFIIGLTTYYLTHMVIPNATKNRLLFEEVYYHGHIAGFYEKNIHKQIEPGLFVYMESYQNESNIGSKFSMERFENGQLKSKLIADMIQWDSTINKWKIRNYYIREISKEGEKITTGRRIDTVLNMFPEQFRQRANIIETMTTPRLNDYLNLQLMQGSINTEPILIEKYRRTAYPFSTFILTIIGVTISSRKIRGGTGMHLGLGLLIAFSYILFMQFASQFAIGGSIPPLLAVWIPNLFYSGIAFFLYTQAAR
jgi:lipopolysaccharide export system permease protein